MYGYGARVFEPNEILEMVEIIEEAEFDDIYGSEFYYAQPLAFKEKNDN